MKLRAVTFDAGGTLLYPYPSVGEIYAEAARRHGANVSAEVMERAFREAWRACHHPEVAGKAGNVSQQEWWRDMVFQTLDLAGVTMADRDAYFRELYELFAHATVWRLFPDARETMTEIKRRGLKIGLLSNWDHRLWPVLKELELLPMLDAVIISCEVGVEKPHPRIFDVARASLGITDPGEMLHVGDSYREDVLGATAVGMRAVLMERAGPAHWSGPTIRQLAELIRVLDDGEG